MIHKLKLAGEELTLNVKTAAIEQGQYGEQVKFTDDGGDVLYVPLSSVERQLDRCGVATPPELSGKAIHFSRAAGKNGVVYWNIDKARDGDVVKTNGKAPETATSKLAAQSGYTDGPLPGEEAEYADALVAMGSPERGTAIRALHARCFKLVCESYVPAAAKAGVDLSLEGVSALTFQLFKAQADAGV